MWWTAFVNTACSNRYQASIEKGIQQGGGALTEQLLRQGRKANGHRVSPGKKKTPASGVYRTESGSQLDGIDQRDAALKGFTRQLFSMLVQVTVIVAEVYLNGA